MSDWDNVWLDDDDEANRAAERNPLATLAGLRDRRVFIRVPEQYVSPDGVIFGRRVIRDGFGCVVSVENSCENVVFTVRPWPRRDVCVTSFPLERYAL